MGVGDAPGVGAGDALELGVGVGGGVTAGVGVGEVLAFGVGDGSGVGVTAGVGDGDGRPEELDELQAERASSIASRATKTLVGVLNFMRTQSAHCPVMGSPSIEASSSS